MNTAQPDKVKRIAIVGPECTGKSTLSSALAKHFNTQWVPEYAREFLNKLGRPYTQEDLFIIAKGQLKEEELLEPKANKFLFCDTNLLVIKIWSDFKFGKTPKKILELWQPNKYSLHLLTAIDVPWEFDPLREHPHKREELYKIYKDELVKSKIPFIEVGGSPAQRLSTAIKAINSLS